MTRLKAGDPRCEDVDFVTLDGVKIEKVVMADEEQGIVEYQLVDCEGNVLVDRVEEEVLTTKAVGDVVIHWKPAPDFKVGDKWQPIETAPSMQTVLIYFETSFGKGHAIRAIYAPEKTWEDTSYDGDFSKYDEESDVYYYPSGWYEDLYNAVDDVGFHYLGSDFKPTHWMPLPQPPQEVEQK